MYFDAHGYEQQKLFPFMSKNSSNSYDMLDKAIKTSQASSKFQNIKISVICMYMHHGICMSMAFAKPACNEALFQTTLSICHKSETKKDAKCKICATNIWWALSNEKKEISFVIHTF